MPLVAVSTKSSVLLFRFDETKPFQEIGLEAPHSSGVKGRCANVTQAAFSHAHSNFLIVGRDDGSVCAFELDTRGWSR